MFLVFRCFFLSVCLLQIGCGDSPFLKDDAPIPKPPVQNGEALFFSKSKMRMEFFWRQGPHIGEESKILLVLTDDNGRPAASSSQFSVKIDMPEMSHDNWPVKVSPIGVGVYELTEMFFTMEGLWVIQFQMKDVSGKLIEEVKWSLQL